MNSENSAGVGPVEQGLGPAPERAALPNRWRVVCPPGAEPYFERHAEGAWAQRERVDAEIAAAVAAERERCAKLCEDRAIHQNGRHVVTLEMNQMAQAIRGKHDFRA